jgi:lysophospholipase
MTWLQGRKLLFALLAGLILRSSFAGAVPEESLPRELTGQIEPFFAASTLETLNGQDDKKIALRRFVNPKATGVVLVVPGYSESMSKYSEVVYDLYHSGYSVVIYDHRGQGFSARLLNDPQRAHIDKFDNLVADLHLVAQKTLSQFTGKKFVLAHSMGGAVVTRELETSGLKIFDAVAMTAPMMKLKINSVALVLIPWILNPLSRFGYNEFYVRGPKDPSTFTFADNRVTHSETRFKLLQQRSVDRSPEAHVWGMTAGWLYQALIGTAQVRAEADKIVTPLLILQAGNDEFVDSTAQVQLCVQVKTCLLENLKEAKHEILMETDSIRAPAMKLILEFFASHSR